LLYRHICKWTNAELVWTGDDKRISDFTLIRPHFQLMCETVPLVAHFVIFSASLSTYRWRKIWCIRKYMETRDRGRIIWEFARRNREKTRKTSARI